MPISSGNPVTVQDNSTEALFNIIKRELNTIVEHGEKNIDAIDNTNERKGETAKADSKEKCAGTTSTLPSASAEKPATQSPRIKAGGIASVDDDDKLSALKRRFKSTLERDIAMQGALLDSPRTKSIDADLQKMQIELQDSYNLFQNISEKFETINFGRLHKRIKNMNLSAKRDAVGKATADELKAAVDEGFKSNHLDKLTSEVGDKFRKHPGEFGNIPELSTFFQACTQLEHGLEQLSRQRSDVRDLEERIRRAAEISYNRVSSIKQQLAEQNVDEPSATDDNLGE